MERAVESPAGRADGEGLADRLEFLRAMLAAMPGPAQLDRTQRLSVIAQIDDDARAALQAPAGDCDRPLSAVRREAAAARDVFGALLDAYQGCLAGAGASDGAAGADGSAEECRERLVRAGGERLKWECCAGGPAHPALWRWLGAAFGDAVACREAAAPRPHGAGGPPGTPVEREYLRALATYCAAYDRVPPGLVFAVDRLIDFCLPMLDLRRDSSVGAICFAVPELATAPSRMLPGVPLVPGIWFLVTRVALRALLELSEQLERGVVPLAFAGVGREPLAAAARHLLSHWSEAPRTRRHRRYVTGGRLTAVRGIEDLRLLFAGESVSYLAEWEFRDMSRGGLGILLPPRCSAAVCVGELVGILPHDGDVWQFGIVRRVWKQADGSTVLGLETLANKPVLVSVDDGAVRAEAFLCDPLLRGEAVRVAVPVGVLRADAPLSVAIDGTVQELKPLEATMSGEGFELRVYQVL